jgi:hypothetical protein
LRSRKLAHRMRSASVMIFRSERANALAITPTRSALACATPDRPPRKGELRRGAAPSPPSPTSPPLAEMSEFARANSGSPPLSYTPQNRIWLPLPRLARKAMALNPPRENRPYNGRHDRRRLHPRACLCRDRGGFGARPAQAPRREGEGVPPPQGEQLCCGSVRRARAQWRAQPAPPARRPGRQLSCESVSGTRGLQAPGAAPAAAGQGGACLGQGPNPAHSAPKPALPPYLHHRRRGDAGQNRHPYQTGQSGKNPAVPSRFRRYNPSLPQFSESA